MNKIKLSITTAALCLVSASAQAHKYHTENFCSSQVTDICMHLGYNDLPVANTPFEFVVDFVNKEKMADISDVEVYLAVEQEDGDIEYHETSLKPLDDHHFLVNSTENFTKKLWGVYVVYSYKKNLTDTVMVQMKDQP